MDDFLLMASSEEEAYELRRRVERVLNRLGLKRNVEKGQWVPLQVVEHLRLEVDFKEGVFRVTQAQLEKITSKATDPLLYLRELYFVLTKKRSLGAKVKLMRYSFGNLEWWKRLQAQCKWNGRRIWSGGILTATGWRTLTCDWSNWINPPWGLLDEVAHKLREEGAGGTVEAPYWSSQSWFRELEEIAEEVVMLARRRNLFVPSRLGGSELLGASSWDAVMFLIPMRP
ncbi:hypothetical protein CYMTET_56355 [Cymbomonas tetramitiformis]|uniref:Reverse transcriptase domain-containing protein n=1 Tax=Cymbomonas tetramitiformis TaxID=36881 RepID=A0AAE0BCB6_9CHLO|nr:hypothetical protein CYMTET_56355 [Cymbomonas tetramitiformis]